jgi:exonuclease SbcC
MIPILLKVTGFLSYKQSVEVDFTSFELACISGSNGAGKSSLLDAITWSLFGQARKRDDSLVNSHPDVKAAEVIFTFCYEDQIYRVQRTLPRGKSQMLEFQIQQGAEHPGGDVIWRPLSEHTVKETQVRILQVLRLDYDTFVNASFFLQGKADQFAQQPASKRKEILGNILGLELWEVYRERTNDRRRGMERDLDAKDGQIQEIELELSEEPARKNRLAELEGQLTRLADARKLQESTLEKLKQLTASLKQQREVVGMLNSALSRAIGNKGDRSTRLEERKKELQRFTQLLERADEVEQVYSNWQKLRKDLEGWETLAEKFREQEKERQPLLGLLGNEQVRLEQEMRTLLAEKTRLDDQQTTLPGMEIKAKTFKDELESIEAKLAERDLKNEDIKQAREEQTGIRFENERLTKDGEELNKRITQLVGTAGATCPVCGGPLNPEDRQKLIEELEARVSDMRNTFRVNKANLDGINGQVEKMEQELAGLVSAENERLSLTTSLAQLSVGIDTIQERLKTWFELESIQLEEVRGLLGAETYLPLVREELSALDTRLADLGYDAAAHDAARRAEVSGRGSENEYHDLASARAAIKPLQEEVDHLELQIEKMDAEIIEQLHEYNTASDLLADQEKTSPDLDAAEQELWTIQEQENGLHQEVGAARQKVDVLKGQRVRKKNLNAEREELATTIGRLKTLERAFGKDGVPALLIEQALPEIQSRANELLERLSDGAMSVRFETQSAYKDKKRDDLKETLDILISDGAGVRDYDLFSGGEAFRVNFAIRLALSEVLSHRKGARLQTLVIDEGFGSQDAQGRQRLIEAINAVRGDFAKVLVITHLDELKDAFQTHIEVTKTNEGSFVCVI